MARRPEVHPATVLTRKELAALNEQLSRMSMTALKDFYCAAHYRCRSEKGYFPAPRAIQELVQVWKTTEVVAEIVRRLQLSSAHVKLWINLNRRGAPINVRNLIVPKTEPVVNLLQKPERFNPGTSSTSENK